MPNKKIVFPEEIRLRFRSFISDRTGLYFKDYDLKDLDGVIAGRMAACGFDSVLSYYAYAIASERKDAEVRELLNRLTVNHTYFFRDEAQFKALAEKILPGLIERKRKAAHSAAGPEKPAIRVWSAGASTGEEPYTIAMVLKDALPDIADWDIQVLATDASEEALERARKGVYGAGALRLVNAEHRCSYFSERPGSGPDARYAVADDIKKLVKFGFFNLMDDAYPGGFDLIFCRNVTIYFEQETTRRVMGKLAGALDGQGCLFIGYSETMQYISDKFQMVNWGDAIFYVKSGEAHGWRPAPPPAAPYKFKAGAVPEELSGAEFRGEFRERAEKKARSKLFGEKLLQAIKALYAKNYREALEFAEAARALDGDDPETYYLEAEVYANQGRLPDAKTCLRAALAKDMLFAPAHYLLGNVRAQEGETAAAEENYRKALYLANDFPLAHYSLANLYRQQGKTSEALREYRNALNVLAKAKPYDIIAYSGGFNAAALASVCKNSIEQLKNAQ